MRRWGLLLGAFAIVVIAFIVWRSSSEQSGQAPASPEDAASSNGTALTGRPQPHVSRAIRPGTPATIAGTVRDVATRAIAGARVCVMLDDSNEDIADEIPPCTTTDAAGAYRLAAVPMSAYSVTAAAPRHRGQAESLRPLQPGEVRDHVDFVLRTGVRVAGRVIDVRGAPIAGARVIAIVSVVTGTDGRFELWVEPTRGIIRASADGFAEAHQSFNPPADLELVLQTAASIAGVVVDAETTAPVPGARVHSGGDPVFADDEGRFELDGLARGRYVIEATTVDRSGRTFEVDVGLAEHVDGVVVFVHTAYQLSIRLRRSDGSVCADPHVEVDAWGKEVGSRWRDGELLRFDGVPAGRYVLTSKCGEHDRTVHPPIDVKGDVLFEITGKQRLIGRLVGKIEGTGREHEMLRVWASNARKSQMAFASEGSYDLELEPGTYRVRAGTDGPETPETTVEIVVGRDTEYNARLSATETGSLVVTVADRDGAPIPGVDVTVARAGTTSSKRPRPTWTDRDGRVRIRLAAGDYDVSASIPFDHDRDDTNTAVQVVAGAERTARLVLREVGWQIRGIVVDREGAPVGGAVIHVTTFSGDGDASRYAVSGADGRFELPGRRFRRGVEVRALRPGGGASPEVRVQSDEPLRLVIDLPALVAGTVAMSDGSAPDRFDIIIKAGNDRVTRTFMHSGGAFTVGNAPTGSIKLGAAINGIEVWTELVLAAGDKRTGISITLPTVASITGRVVDAGTNTPVEGVKLNLMCTRDGEPLAFNHADQRSDLDGRFLIRELPPGPCVVEVRPPSSAWLSSNRTITVPERGTGDIGEIAIARAR